VHKEILDSMNRCYQIRYLGLRFQKDENIDKYVSHKIKVRWLKYQISSGMCQTRVPQKLHKFYSIVIPPVILYRAE
jgi:hypothetical protein